MILHFLRHAQAESILPGSLTDDRSRILTSKGRNLMRQAACGFLKIGVQFDFILSSPYPRALETAKIVAEVFKYQKEIHTSQNLTPDALFNKFHKEMIDLDGLYNAVLIVTHQPFVSECIACLLTGKAIPIGVNMGTGALCTMEVDSAFKSAAFLNSMIRAEDAALIK